MPISCETLVPFCAGHENDGPTGVPVPVETAGELTLDGGGEINERGGTTRLGDDPVETLAGVVVIVTTSGAAVLVVVTVEVVLINPPIVTVCEVSVSCSDCWMHILLAHLYIER